MSEKDNFTPLISEVKNGKVPRTFDELKIFLSNEILIHYQFDLPKEFNFSDILQLPFNHRFMRNFSKTLSFTRSFEQIKNDLRDYFNYKPELVTKKLAKKRHEKKSSEYSFKQVFFNIDPENSSKYVVDDITDFNLEKASVDSLKSVISNVELGIDESNEINKNEIEKKSEFSSDKTTKQPYQQSPTFIPTFEEEAGIDHLLRDFKIQDNESKDLEQESESVLSKDKLVSETFKLLGIGSIKKNLGKSIITKKKKVGLSFDEWVPEHLEWIQFLIKKLAHLQYLSLKDESNYLNIVRKYTFSGDFNKELEKLYKVLRIDH